MEFDLKRLFEDGAQGESAVPYVCPMPAQAGTMFPTSTQSGLILDEEERRLAYLCAAAVRTPQAMG